MIAILMGPPGAGKGTQGNRITAVCGVPKISTGEMFRDLAAAGTPLGVQAKSYWSNGKLVPDDVVVGLVSERISRTDCINGFLLDGFPRTVAQAEILSSLLTQSDRRLDAVLDFEVLPSELIRRLSGRRTCSNCGATYHVTRLPSRVENVCDHCHHMLSQRTDDTPASIEVRLQEYSNKTEPLLKWYADKGLLFTVDANGDPDAVFDSVRNIMSTLQRQ